MTRQHVLLLLPERQDPSWASTGTTQVSEKKEKGDQLTNMQKFEGDTSLTRNDYFPANGNNFLFNASLFQQMSKTCNGLFNRNNLALYRYNRWTQSLNSNGQFYFGPKSLLLFGAASFLYELFPSKGELGNPDQTTMDYFFLPEMLPPKWYSRADPYTIPLVANEINAQYNLHPVPFGGNTGKPNSFVGISSNGPYFSSNGTYTGGASGVECLLYQFATENEPSSISGLSNIPVANFEWAASKLNPVYINAGSPCPRRSASMSFKRLGADSNDSELQQRLNEIDDSAALRGAKRRPVESRRKTAGRVCRSGANRAEEFS